MIGFDGTFKIKKGVNRLILISIETNWGKWNNDRCSRHKDQLF